MSAAPVILTPEEQQLAVEREAYRKFKGVYQQISAKAIRDWVRAELIPPALLRLYRIGMGVETFKIPTQAGNLVDVEAFASVQVDALSKLVDIGVPRQLGLVDNTDGELPGIMALGTLDLEEVQVAHEQRYLGAGNGHVRTVHGEATNGAASDENVAGVGMETSGLPASRSGDMDQGQAAGAQDPQGARATASQQKEATPPSLPRHHGDRVTGARPVRVLQPNGDDARSHRATGEGRDARGGESDPSVPPMQLPQGHTQTDRFSGVTLSPSVRRGGYEIVEVEQETFAAPDGEKPGEVPPPAVPQEPTLAQQILARRRAARRNGRPSSSDETP